MSTVKLIFSVVAFPNSSSTFRCKTFAPSVSDKSFSNSVCGIFHEVLFSIAFQVLKSSSFPVIWYEIPFIFELSFTVPEIVIVVDVKKSPSFRFFTSISGAFVSKFTVLLTTVVFPHQSVAFIS